MYTHTHTYRRLNYVGVRVQPRFTGIYLHTFLFQRALYHRCLSRKFSNNVWHPWRMSNRGGGDGELSIFWTAVIVKRERDYITDLSGLVSKREKNLCFDSSEFVLSTDGLFETSKPLGTPKKVSSFDNSKLCIFFWWFETWIRKDTKNRE